jgi:signal transduction histidine kinase
MAENLKKTTASKAELEATHEQLKVAQAQIIQTVKMTGVGQLAASVAHEINNPLCFVMNNAELLKSGGKNTLPGSAEFNESVEAILDGARRIKNITHALLDFARLNVKEDERLNVNEVVEKALYLVYPETKNTCTIEKNLSNGPQMVRGKESELMQVLINVLLNAYQASRQKGVIKISTYLQNDFVIIEVSDNGTGIDEKNMPHIFEPFFTTKNPGQGTGLGLSTSREIIKKHGGEINITSKAGEGTTVKVILPRCQKSGA